MITMDACARCPRESSTEYGIVILPLNPTTGVNVAIPLDGLTVTVPSGSIRVVWGSLMSILRSSVEL